MKEVWILMSCHGSWDDYRENPVQVCSSLQKAVIVFEEKNAVLEEENIIAHRQQELFEEEYDTWLEQEMSDETWADILSDLFKKYPKAKDQYETPHSYKIVGPIPFQS